MARGLIEAERTRPNIELPSSPAPESPGSPAPASLEIAGISLSRLALLTVPPWLLLLWLAFSLTSETAAAVVAVAGILFYALQVFTANAQARLDFDVQLARIRQDVKRRIDDLNLADAGFSRRYLEMRLDQEVKRSQRYRLPLSFVLLRTPAETVTAGGWEDTAAEVVSTASRLLRIEDVLGHLGTNEYGVILPHTNRDQAGIVIKRLQTALSASSPEFGVAQLSTGVSTAEALILTAHGSLETRSHRNTPSTLPPTGDKAA